MIRLVNLYFLFWDEFPNGDILDLFFTCDTLYFCVVQIYTFGNLFMKKLQRKQQISSKPWIISRDMIFTVQLSWMLIFNRYGLTCRQLDIVGHTGPRFPKVRSAGRKRFVDYRSQVV